MQFSPAGYIAIPQAVQLVVEARHPAEHSGAAAALRKSTSSELPPSYYLHSAHVDEAEKLLLQAFADCELAAIVHRSGSRWTVPAEYWKTDGARVVTLLHGLLATSNSSSEDWRNYHGDACFVENGRFTNWLNAKSFPAADHWLAHDRLELAVIISIARGAQPMDWPPPTGGEWHARFRALKAMIDGGNLPATLRGPVASKSTVVRLADMQGFGQSHPTSEWDWLREFCSRWAIAGGNRAAVGEVGRPVMQAVNVSHTGGAGRPTVLHLLKTELERRAAAGELKPTLAAEAEFLAAWAAGTFPEAPSVTPKTVQNNLRDRYRELVAKRPK